MKRMLPIIAVLTSFSCSPTPYISSVVVNLSSTSMREDSQVQKESSRNADLSVKRMAGFVMGELEKILSNTDPAQTSAKNSIAGEVGITASGRFSGEFAYIYSKERLVCIYQHFDEEGGSPRHIQFFDLFPFGSPDGISVVKYQAGRVVENYYDAPVKFPKLYYTMISYLYHEMHRQKREGKEWGHAELERTAEDKQKEFELAYKDLIQYLSTQKPTLEMMHIMSK